MSRDDEIAVMYDKGFWYVKHIFAQRTSDVIKSGRSFASKDTAVSYADSLDQDINTEYGVCVYE